MQIHADDVARRPGASARGQIQFEHGVGVGAFVAPYFPPEMNRAEVEWFSFVLLDCTDALLERELR